MYIFSLVGMKWTSAGKLRSIVIRPCPIKLKEVACTGLNIGSGPIQIPSNSILFPVTQINLIMWN